MPSENFYTFTYKSEGSVSSYSYCEVKTNPNLVTVITFSHKEKLKNDLKRRDKADNMISAIKRTFEWHTQTQFYDLFNPIEFISSEKFYKAYSAFDRLAASFDEGLFNLKSYYRKDNNAI